MSRRAAVLAPEPRVGSSGELVPVRGFSRTRAPGLPMIAWRSHDGLLVTSSLVVANLPGSGEPPLAGPTWVVSISRGGVARCSSAEVERVAACFAMPAFDEDNHAPGITRTLFCPLDPQYRSACECKAREILVTEPDGYRWTTTAEDCRGLPVRADVPPAVPDPQTRSAAVRLPPGALGDRATRVLLAVLLDPHPTVGSARARVRIRSLETTHADLCRLRAAGLVDWTDNAKGTLHPLVRPVRFGV